MNCPHCSKEIPDDARVCPYCAKKIGLTREKALETLGIAPDLSPDEMKTKYFEKHNEVTLLIQNAPTPLLRERYATRLEGIKEAGEALFGKMEQAPSSAALNMPSARPVDAPDTPLRPSAPEPERRTESAAAAREPEKKAYAGVPDKSKATAYLLAIFASPLGWLYTFRKDGLRFWISMLTYLIIFTPVYFKYERYSYFIYNNNATSILNFSSLILSLVFIILPITLMLNLIAFALVKGTGDDVYNRYNTLFPADRPWWKMPADQKQKKTYLVSMASAIVTVLMMLAVFIDAGQLAGINSSWVSMVKNPKFVDKADGTVIEENTGFMWTKSPVLTDKPEEALKNLKAGGHSDWRLPKDIEINALIYTINLHKNSFAFNIRQYMNPTGLQKDLNFWCQGQFDRNKIEQRVSISLNPEYGSSTLHEFRPDPSIQYSQWKKYAFLWAVRKK